MKKKYICLVISILSIGLIACGSEKENISEEPVSAEAETTVEEVIPEEPVVDAVEEPEEKDPEIIEEEEVQVPEVSEEVKEEKDQAEYTFKDIAETKYVKSTVNVRDLPEKTGNKVGSLVQNDEVTVTGQCNETDWYRIDYKGQVAYVSNDFLVDEKVEAAPPAANNTPADNNSPVNGGTGSGVYSNEYGQTYTMTYDDVVAAFGQPIGVVIQDSDTSGHFYVIVSHIRGVKGSPISSIVDRIAGEGWSSVGTTDNYAASYDNKNWEIQVGYCNK